jgi:hypothetical protein
VSRARTAALAAVAALFLMGPTPGDVGACGRTAAELDKNAYAESRKLVECSRCQECGIDGDLCRRACDPAQPPTTQLPATCRPIVHDGEVCLRAMRAASCSTFATYVDDAAPQAPTECDFCRVPPPPPVVPSGGFGGGDAGPIADAGGG